MGYLLNGVSTGGLPIHLVKPLIENHEINYFVETGTAGGDSIREVYELFKYVWTVELIKDRTDTKNAPKNVRFIEGDSVEHLPEIIEQLLLFRGEKERQYVLFYLDAHFCDDKPNESDYPECPVLEEIKCIAEYGEDAVIIIDDARLFFGSPPYPNDPTEWPSISEIFFVLQTLFPFHHTTITDDYVLSIPLHLKDTIDKEWRDRFHIRYPNAEDKLRGQVKDVHAAFMDKVYKPFLEYIK